MSRGLLPSEPETEKAQVQTMPRCIPTVVFTFFIILQPIFRAPAISASDKELYYRLKERWIRSSVAVFPIDVNDDGLDEIAMQSKDQMDIIDPDLNYYERSFRISGPVNYQFSVLLPAIDGSPPFLASYNTADSCIHKILLPTNLTRGKSIAEDSLKPLISFYRSDGSSRYDFKESLMMLAHYKDKAGREVTLFQVMTSWDARGKRGLIAYDIYNRKILWERDFAPVIHCFQMDDIDGDNEIEIILGMYANQNGLNVNGTTDDSSYVFVFEADGSEKWKRTVGPGWTGAWVGAGDFNGDGKKNIVVYQYSVRVTDPNQDKIQIVDAENGCTIVAPKRIGNQFTFARNNKLNICNDFNGDGRDEIIVGGTDGFVRLFNGELTEIEHSESFDNKPITVEAVEDLDGDGSFEIVCVIPNERIVILDHQLKTLYSWPLPIPEYVKINTVHGETKSHLLVSTTEGGIITHRLFELQRSIYPFEVVEKVKGISLWVIACCLLALFIIFIRNIFFGSKAKKILPELLEQANLLDHCLLVTKDGVIKNIGKLWESLFQIQTFNLGGKHWSEMFKAESLKPVKTILSEFSEQLSNEKSLMFSIQGNGEQVAIKLKSLYFPNVKSFCFMIFDMSEEAHVRQVKHWAQVAQRLAHGIKNPLTTVKLNAEELRHVLETKCKQDLPDVDDYFDAMIHQVNKLKKMSDGFMQFVEFEKPNLRSTDLNAMIHEFVDLWKPEKSTGIDIDLELDDGLSPTMLDTQQFEFALKNIFFNAVESMTKGGRILISTRGVTLLNNDKGHSAKIYNELQISDTGCGIPPEFLEKVTQPYFTRNKIEGTGLGLSIVQKIMDSHEGEMEIFSEVDFGTTVTLRFRIKPD